MEAHKSGMPCFLCQSLLLSTGLPLAHLKFIHENSRFLTTHKILYPRKYVALRYIYSDSLIQTIH